MRRGWSACLSVLWIAVLTAGCAPAATLTPLPTVDLPPTPLSATETPLPFEMTCTVISQAVESTPASLFPAPSETDWSLGAQDALMTVIEYASPRSPAAAQVNTTLQALLQAYPQQFRLVLRPLADPADPLALLAGQALEAADMQRRVWNMYDTLLSRQADWANLDEAALRTWLVEQAAGLGMDAQQFASDLDSNAAAQRVLDKQAQAAALGVPGALLLLVNGQIYQGAADYSSLEALLRLFDLQARQYHACPPTVIDPHNTYMAVLETEKGRVVVELYPDKAPLAVNSFVFLAQNGWYDNTTFHVVVKDLLVQGGDPSGTGYGNAGYAFANESFPDLTFDRAGMLAMADGNNSNSSQFFINMSPQSDWNGRYTIFGRVLEGMDILQALSERNPAAQLNPPPGDRLIRVAIRQGN